MSVIALVFTPIFKPRASRSRGVRRLLGLASLAPALVLACATPEPRLDYGDLSLPETDRVLEYAIYTPPGFAPQERLPLVVFLHGAGDGPDCFDEAQVGQHLDTQIANGQVPRAVIVIPRGDFGFWENWADGSFLYRDWVVRSLIPELRSLGLDPRVIDAFRELTRQLDLAR